MCADKFLAKVRAVDMFLNEISDRNKLGGQLSGESVIDSEQSEAVDVFLVGNIPRSSSSWISLHQLALHGYFPALTFILKVFFFVRGFYFFGSLDSVYLVMEY